MKAVLAFLAGVACALTLTRHDPVRQFIGGVRCRRCGASARTPGEMLGLDDAVQTTNLRRVK